MTRFKRQLRDRLGILCIMPLIKAIGRSVAAGACALTLLTTPAVAATPDAPALVAVGRLLPDVVMAGLNCEQALKFDQEFGLTGVED